MVEMITRVVVGNQVIGTMDPVPLRGLYLMINTPDGEIVKFNWCFDDNGNPCVSASNKNPWLLPGFKSPYDRTYPEEHKMLTMERTRRMYEREEIERENGRERYTDFRSYD